MAPEVGKPRRAQWANNNHDLVDIFHHPICRRRECTECIWLLKLDLTGGKEDRCSFSLVLLADRANATWLRKVYVQDDLVGSFSVVMFSYTLHSGRLSDPNPLCTT